MDKKQEKQNFFPIILVSNPWKYRGKGEQKMFAKFTSRRGLINPRQQICQNEHWSRGREKQNKKYTQNECCCEMEKEKKKCHKGFPPARFV